MKILWVNHISLDSDVYSTFPLQIVYALRKRGHHVQLIVPSVNNKNRSSLFTDVTFVPVIRLPILSILSFFFLLLFYIPKFIKKERPDVIIGNLWEYPGLIIATLFRRTKLVFDARASIGNYSFSRELIVYSTAIKIAMHLKNGITVTSKALKEELCAYGINKKRIGVITNGVSMELFDNQDQGSFAERFREEHNLKGKFIIMYHGSLGPLRGLPQTLKAIKICSSKHPDIIFFILGSGNKNYESKIKNFTAQNSLENNILLHPPVVHDQVPKFLSICNVGIVALATYSYPATSCPLKLLEYMAMGKPVISTTIHFSKEVFAQGKCGELISSNKPQHIAAAIEHMYNHKDMLLQMGAVGRTIVEQHYTWLEKAKDFENFIGELSQ